MSSLLNNYINIYKDGSYKARGTFTEASPASMAKELLANDVESIVYIPEGGKSIVQWYTEPSITAKSNKVICNRIIQVESLPDSLRMALLIGGE